MAARHAAHEHVPPCGDATSTVETAAETAGVPPAEALAVLVSQLGRARFDETDTFRLAADARASIRRVLDAMSPAPRPRRRGQTRASIALAHVPAAAHDVSVRDLGAR